jgi:uncharacterized protein YegP (UPF0339 family)
MNGMQHDELAEVDLTEADIDTMIAEGEPVHVTGPFDPVRRVRFELVGGGPSAFRWRIVAANGEILATSAAAYRSPEDARRAASALSLALRESPMTEINSV